MKYKDCKVNIFNTVYTIKFVDEIKNDNPSNNEYEYPYGITHFRTKEILIAKKDHYCNREFSNSEIFITLLHELLHAISGEGQYETINNDEPFIEWTARCLYEILKKKVLNKCGIDCQ